MELEFSGSTIKMDKELSDLDKLAIRFVGALDGLKVDYVIVSGYVAILFGRSRNTEDVDIFIEEMPLEKFKALWEELNRRGFECLNTGTAEKAYQQYLKEQIPVRFAEKGKVIPNFEIKFPKTKYNIYSLKNKLEVRLNNESIVTSELELQIAFKLSLGSDKDFEDARHLYQVFKGHLNLDLLKRQIRELKVGKQAEKVLWKKG